MRRQGTPAGDAASVRRRRELAAQLRGVADALGELVDRIDAAEASGSEADRRAVSVDAAPVLSVGMTLAREAARIVKADRARPVGRGGNRG